MKHIETIEKLYEDEGGGGGGTAYSTMGNMNGMGAVVSAQPSSIPGNVSNSSIGPGSTIGSGDIGSTLGVYDKYSAYNKKKRKKGSKKNENVIMTFDAFDECNQYGNTPDIKKYTTCSNCGEKVEDNIVSKKGHVYSKHWAHSYKNDDEANILISNFFDKPYIKGIKKLNDFVHSSI